MSEDTIHLQDQTTRSLENPQFCKTILGGDQLTAARVRGATTLHLTQGVAPVVEDWHARMTLMKVFGVCVCQWIENRMEWGCRDEWSGGRERGRKVYST